ncbi:alpha/beta fold hydrolase [Paenibacillus macerans]|uniref:Xylan esterase 1 n=3 Tax=Paenibacillus macerans TaxID=44252 RepID=A0A090ZI16_PAEMA|nr:alpha/beta fold hydrolase [Paenibacillus macerans]KFN10033.1 xylan esterase 1 [Paenibacillus macerans]MBS5909682.1 alpha/beta fold hydrolase [Paenibacillus macerans]MCY7558994.1 acetylxylan esterase [Paenibacillus macerans]MDU5949193.1 alpha/beta fold hydrolase [Paenibacillus macerans]MEC0141030.1 alpha/beta fold hydrolase [Paenibacillus macerans]
MANDRIEDLLKYQGSSPKPRDFHAYWERALKELDAQPLDYELAAADFQTPLAECYDLYFTGVGGARVHAKYVKPRAVKGKGQGLALFHGYHTGSGDWFDKAAYAAHGIAVIAPDCRGQGGLSEDNLTVKGTTLKGHIIRGIDEEDPDKLYYRNVFLDLVQTVRILMSMEEVDPDRIGVHGCSQGGALTVACAALEPRVKLAIPVYPFLTDYKKAWEMDVTSSAYEELAYYFRFMDPLHETQEAFFNKLGYIDIQNLADRIRAKVIFVTGLADSICPPYTQFAAYNKIVSEKELVVYHEYGHEYLPYLGDRVLQEMLEL